MELAFELDFPPTLVARLLLQDLLALSRQVHPPPPPPPPPTHTHTNQPITSYPARFTHIIYRVVMRSDHVAAASSCSVSVVEAGNGRRLPHGGWVAQGGEVRGGAQRVTEALRNPGLLLHWRCEAAAAAEAAASEQVSGEWPSWQKDLRFQPSARAPPPPPAHTYTHRYQSA